MVDLLQAPQESEKTKQSANSASVNFSPAAYLQLQPGTKKSFVTSLEGPSSVKESIEEPSVIDE